MYLFLHTVSYNETLLGCSLHSIYLHQENRTSAKIRNVHIVNPVSAGAVFLNLTSFFR